jgi:hypothetical protein
MSLRTVIDYELYYMESVSSREKILVFVATGLALWFIQPPATWVP